MKTLTSYIKEGLNKFVVNAVTRLGHENSSFSTLKDAYSWISQLGDCTYWDITTGDNSSEESNLVEWAGEGGYWYYFCYNPVHRQTRKEEAIAERAKKKRVDLYKYENEK